MLAGSAQLSKYTYMCHVLQESGLAYLCAMAST